MGKTNLRGYKIWTNPKRIHQKNRRDKYEY